VDLLDVVRKVFHKDPSARSDTAARVPGKIHISGLPAAGYTLQTGFAGVVSGNLAYYSSADPEMGISSIASNLTYSQYNQIIFPITANLWSKNGKYNFLTDCRVLKYPSSTFGLGGNTSLSDENDIYYSYLRLHQAVLRSVAKNLFIGPGLDIDYFWNIRELNPDSGSKNDFETYGLSKKEAAAGVSLNLVYDTRKNSINPHNGSFLNIAYNPKFKFMGSEENWQSLTVEYKHYFKLGAKSDNVIAFWSYNWFTLGGRPPYLLLPSDGWDPYANTGRGYIQGRFKGSNMVYLETEYRFGITRNGLIGGVVFANAETYTSRLATVTGKTTISSFDPLEPGVGLGIRIKLNKFSKTNLCIDYGWGAKGSGGIAVNLGEVF
jgi:outer membrane protein assembly factor BamA